jgi:hypothetical protein
MLNLSEAFSKLIWGEMPKIIPYRSVPDNVPFTQVGVDTFILRTHAITVYIIINFRDFKKIGALFGQRTA